MAYLTSIVPPIIIYNKHILKIKLTENRAWGKQWIVMQKQCAHREKSIYQLEWEIIMGSTMKGWGTWVGKGTSQMVLGW